MTQQEISDKIATFFERYPRHEFDKQQIIIRAGQAQGDVFYIAKGRVNQYDITPSGNEVVVNVFKPGAYFPMSSAINDIPNIYFFEASIKTVIFKAPAHDAVAFVKNNPDVMFDLLSRVYKGADGILRRMAHLMGGDAESRLLFELLNAARRFGQSRPDGSVHVTLNEGDLGRHAGLARETVSRCLQDLKTRGLIAVGVGRSGITIRDMSQLEKKLGAAL